MSDLIGELSPREREVLALIAGGWSNRAICGALFISPKTLERHVQHIFAKLELTPGTRQHRRVLAALAWLRSDFSHADAGIVHALA
jgi:DNA-binding NarL/FixJ family response regulator